MPNYKTFLDQYGTSTPFLDVMAKGIIDAVGYDVDSLQKVIDTLISSHQQNSAGDDDHTVFDTMDPDVREVIEPTMRGITEAWYDKHGVNNGFVNFFDSSAHPEIQRLAGRLDTFLSQAAKEGQVGFRQ
jgi:hypothetical protein